MRRERSAALLTENGGLSSCARRGQREVGRSNASPSAVARQRQALVAGALTFSTVARSDPQRRAAPEKHTPVGERGRSEAVSRRRGRRHDPHQTPATHAARRRTRRSCSGRSAGRPRSRWPSSRRGRRTRRRTRSRRHPRCRWPSRGAPTARRIRPQVFFAAAFSRACSRRVGSRSYALVTVRSTAGWSRNTKRALARTSRTRRASNVVARRLRASSSALSGRVDAAAPPGQRAALPRGHGRGRSTRARNRRSRRCWEQRLSAKAAKSWSSVASASSGGVVGVRVDHCAQPGVFVGLDAVVEVRLGGEAEVARDLLGFEARVHHTARRGADRSAASAPPA